MKVVIAKETAAGERRVALVPESVSRLVGAGMEVLIEAGAGAAAGFLDAAYTEAGARVVEVRAELLREAGFFAAVQPPKGEQQDGKELDLLPEGAALVGMLRPMESPDLVRRLLDRRLTAFAMELVPRITRAQKMDALSSQATAAGYQAALLAAIRLNKFFPMLMTAAGTAAPAKVLVIGAGVAGLQAIATARRLGAVVQAFDIRPAVKEQVESLGARFVGLTVEGAEDAGGYAVEVDEDMQRREHELLHKLVAESDAVITTAQVPGKKAPLLITTDMVEAMRPGSVIVDLAAEAGGNCELTKAGEEVLHDGVIILGPADLPSAVAFHASQMYSRNVTELLLHLVKEGALQLDFEDEITRGCCVTHAGELPNPALRELIPA